MKPILCQIKDEEKKRQDDGILFESFKQLIETNTGIFKTICENITNNKGDNRISRLMKPARVPSWNKDMSLETFIKHIEIWAQSNVDVPENTKYQDLL